MIRIIYSNIYGNWIYVVSITGKSVSKLNSKRYLRRPLELDPANVIFSNTLPFYFGRK